MKNDKKPVVKMIGEDGNIFNLLGIARKALMRNGQSDKAEEMADKVYDASSYDEALSFITDYVDVE